MKQVVNWMHSQNGFIKGLTVTLFSILALVLTPALASAQPSIEVGSEAKLIGGGGAIILPVTIACDPGSGILSFSAQATQGSGKRIAQGSGGAATAGIICDNTPRAVDIFIPANILGVPFKKGAAAANANFTYCEPQPSFRCLGISDFGEITIVR